MRNEEIAEKEFSTSLRGFNQDEVYAFLETLAQEWNLMEKEREGLRRELVSATESLKVYQEKEQALTQTLSSVEKNRAETQELARREAEIIRNEARIESERILRQSEAKRQMLMEDIRQLEVFYARLRARLKVVLDTFSDLLRSPEELREELQLRRVPVEDASSGPTGEV